MNIFVLSLDPREAAQYHCNKHVVKMVLETAQILSTVKYKYRMVAPYKPTHMSHPCVIWAGESAENYSWTFDLFDYLLQEYTYRYGRIHKCEELRHSLMASPQFDKVGATPFALAMPEQYRCAHPVAAYRAYYLAEKLRIASWTKRPVPAFVTEYLETHS